MLKRIKVRGAPNPNKKICGIRPNIVQDVYNPMIPCTLLPRHKGKHLWKLINESQANRKAGKTSK